MEFVERIDKLRAKVEDLAKDQKNFGSLRDSLFFLEEEFKGQLFADSATPGRGGKAALTLPDMEPEPWPGEQRRGRGRQDERRESVADFVRRVYAPWLNAGVISKAHLKKIAPTLASTLKRYESRHPEDRVAGFVPERSIDVDAIVAELAATYDEDVLRRVGLALQARRQRRLRKAPSPQ